MPGTARQIISNLVNRTKGLDEIHDDVAILDGIVDVPAKDATADVQMSDVVGKKDDTAQTTVATTRSLMAYCKGILNDLANGTDGLGALKALIDTTTTNVGTVDTVVDGIQTDLSNATDGLGALKSLIDGVETKVDTLTTNVGTVDGYHDVPTKDAATDTHIRDVVGKKDDTSVTTVGTTKSLVAYTKGVMNDLSNATDGLGALKDLIDTATTNVGTVDTVVDGIQTDLSNGTDGLGALKTLIDAVPTTMVGTDNAALASAWTSALATILGNFTAARIGYMDELAAANLPTDVSNVKAKTDLLNSAAGTSTLNDANPSDTIVPGSLPTKMNVVFDISTIIVASDDFTLEVKVGASGSERVVAYYKITSDGTDTTIDTGSGIGAVVKQRRIDISDIMVYTGEQVLLNYTKSSATDRDVLYRYVCGV